MDLDRGDAASRIRGHDGDARPRREISRRVTSQSRRETRRAVEAALADAAQEFSVAGPGYEMDVVLFSPQEFDEGQIGYAASPTGESLVAEDGWQENWLVI